MSDIVIIIQDKKETVEVVAQGPQGPQGPAGPQGPPGSSTFLALTDTPASYTGQTGKVVKVKTTEDGLEFGIGGGGGASTFLDLTDTPASYTGQGGKPVRVNAGATGLEFSPIPETQLTLNFATHSNANDPTAGEKGALAGTSGTPSATNKYVTNTDARNSDARTPTAHKTTHESGGSDPIGHDSLTGFDSTKHRQLLIGTLVARPAFGTADRFYWAADTKELFRDTGTAWDRLTTDWADVRNKSIVNAEVAAGAGIVESKLALNNPTHSNANDPSADEKGALPGTNGIPSATNKYVTNSDPRNSDTRTPTTHATTHQSGGSDLVNHDSLTGFDTTKHRQLLIGLLTSRPVAGTADRFYYATDTKEIFRDTGTVWDRITTDWADIRNKSIVNAEVAAGAGIVESKLALNNPTHSNSNDPSAGEKAALAGKTGTPSGTNKYETEAGRGVASGLATLDTGAKVPTAQLGGAGADNTKFLRGDQSWQVPAGGGGGSNATLWPRIDTDRWYVTPGAKVLYTVTPYLGEMHAVPFMTPDTITVDAIAIDIATGAGAGGVARLGIYDDNGSYQPGNLVKDAGEIVTTAAGIISAAISPAQSLTGGTRYWLVVLYGTAAPVVRDIDEIWAAFGVGSSNFQTQYGYLGWYKVQTYGALPATFGIPSGSTKVGVVRSTAIGLRRSA